ncbi:MAG TPA: hypothetical protein VFO76_03565, partial [Candidatus Kapabacteria bacterium]|nr:hypothetical protein [Candidatus Kapabacteria bacterium]
MVGSHRRNAFWLALIVSTAFLGLFVPTLSAQYSREPIGTSFSYESEAPASAKIGRPITFIPAPPLVTTPQAAPVYKTSGKDFIVAFSSSVGNDDPSDPPYKRLYISARAQVHGKVSLIGGGWETSFVTDPNKVTMVVLPSWAGLERNQTEQVYKRVFEVTAEDEVAVYALSHRSLSSDGFLVLPVEALGTQYSTANLRNALYYRGGKLPQFSNYPKDTLPRSEFTIAGVADGTIVTVVPTANSFGRNFLANNSYTFTLNRGEVIEITARDTAMVGMIGNALCWVGKLPGVDCDL